MACISQFLYSIGNEIDVPMFTCALPAFLLHLELFPSPSETGKRELEKWLVTTLAVFQRKRGWQAFSVGCLGTSRAHYKFKDNF
jgi:hypothetical protein